jgi:mRNA-degrading endonuclease toxin of MazEF toxin-antitoxin module
VLVISADPYNRSTLQTVTVVVLSTTPATDAPFTG